MERQTQKDSREEGPVVLFDGVCNLCNGFVNFIIDRDLHGVFRFGSLQSQEASGLLRRKFPDVHVNPDALDSIILVDQGFVYTHSTAVLRIFSRLGSPWKLLYGLIVVPRSVRDWVYDLIASNRYSWFGQRQECRVPRPELMDRFL
jgi:predicted DCC family thiol-disulfide oxidoreductase YuxK